MRLIDETELKEWVENWFYQHKYYHPYSKSNSIPCSELYDILERLPTIDAVEVVRCKDCKYRYKMACHKAEFYECSHIGLTSENGKITHVGVDDDYFCADGERRDPCSSQAS